MRIGWWRCRRGGSGRGAGWVRWEKRGRQFHRRRKGEFTRRHLDPCGELRMCSGAAEGVATVTGRATKRNRSLFRDGYGGRTDTCRAYVVERNCIRKLQSSKAPIGSQA